jgi:hypothetical protein
MLVEKIVMGLDVPSCFLTWFQNTHYDFLFDILSVMINS